MLLREMELFCAFAHSTVVMTLRFDATPMRSDLGWFNFVFIENRLYSVKIFGEYSNVKHLSLLFP